MSYEVRCECGKAVAVSAADAGSSVPCSCGRKVDVPPLHQLRASAGEQGVSPVVQLQAMLHNGELPGTRACACCRRETDHLVRVSVVCERVSVQESSSKGAFLLGCLAAGFLAGLAAIVLSKSGRQPVQHGTHVSFALPVRACEACDQGLRSAPDLRKALAETPAYAALLDQYPNAEVRRLE